MVVVVAARGGGGLLCGQARDVGGYYTSLTRSNRDRVDKFTKTLKTEFEPRRSCKKPHKRKRKEEEGRVSSSESS